ncbi:MAG: VWA domain-containing protein [Spirochaetaceae bacterium]|jgi:Ca-activated chloride channel family protein|nr:VWA domain-containing protein [Spirochaetaceae bacterium]
MSLGFERLLLIPAGAAVVIILCGLSRLFRDALTLEIPLGPPGGVPFKPALNLTLFIKFLGIPKLCGVFLLFVAAAGPRLVSTELIWLNRGADILFVLDISPSMAGLDMDGRNRFDAARDMVREFADSRPADAIGLVAVGNEAGLLLPPTVDRPLLYSRLDTLRIGELGDGTALGLGLAIAALHIRGSAAPRRAVALITDGENNAGAVHPETAAEALRASGASLWVIGVGSAGEVPIDYVDPVLKVRRTGSFDSRVDPEALRAIARKGGGTFIAAPSGKAFSDAFAQFSDAEMTVGRSGTMSRTRDVQRPVIVTALILILLPRFIRRWLLGAFL